MSTKQEQRLLVHEREGVGGQRGALSDTWSATSAQPKPEREAGAERHRTFVRPRRGEAQDGPNEGRGRGRLRRRERSEWERALRASSGGAA